MSPHDRTTPNVDFWRTKGHTNISCVSPYRDPGEERQILLTTVRANKLRNLSVQQDPTFSPPSPTGESLCLCCLIFPGGTWSDPDWERETRHSQIHNGVVGTGVCRDQ